MIKRKLVQAFIFITFIISSNFKVNKNQGRKRKINFNLTKKKNEGFLENISNFQLNKA
jgi:hypothetical protein